MFHANWIFGDDHEYITSTAIDKYCDAGGFTSVGRFMPLRYVIYNLPLFIFRLFGINTGLPVEAHFVIVAIIFIITFICLFLLFNKIEPYVGNKHTVFSLFFACTFIFLCSEFHYIYMDIIFPETQVIMLISIFMLMYYNALKTDKKRYYIAAAITAIFSTYCKEPIFGMFLIFALTNIFFRYKNESKNEKIFYITLVINGVLFITLYYLFSYRNATVFYNEGRISLEVINFMLSIFIKNPVLIFMFFIGVFRLYYIIVKRDREHLYYDSLLFAGIAYTFAYILLRLNAGYYFAPSIILFMPSLVYWLKYGWEKKRIYALFVFILLLPLNTIYLAKAESDVRNTWHKRQIFMPYIEDLFSKYNTSNGFIWYESDNRINDNTFYIAKRDWRKYVINAFLNYLNISEGKDYFVVKNHKDLIDMEQNILFFYPIDNDQNQPMPDGLVKTLKDNDFELYTDLSDVFIYRKASSYFSENNRK